MDIVVLHGWNLSADRFAPLTATLRKRGHRVFAPDLPGFGRQPPPSTPWHVSDYAEFLHAYINKNRIQHPVLIGHSFGARVALIYTQLHTGSPAALVLSGAPGFRPSLSVKRLLFWATAKISKVFFAIPPFHLFEKKAQAFLYRVSGSREFLQAEGVMKQIFKNVVADSLMGAMQSVHIPCLLVWGEDDRMVPVAIARRMKRTIAGSELRLIAGADHSVPFKEPQIFADHVEDFLKTV